MSLRPSCLRARSRARSRADLVIRVIFLLTVVWASTAGHASTATGSDVETIALRQRVAALEARLAAIEAVQGAAGEPAAATDDRLIDRLITVEARLARIEQLLIAAPAPQIASLSPAHDSGGLTSATSLTERVRSSGETHLASAGPAGGAIEAAGESVSIHSKELFLPSRGDAGGALHYGGGTGKPIELHAFLDLEYTDAGVDGSRNGVSTFDNHHANIFVRSQLRKNLLGHIEVEYEHSGDVVEIDQAFLSWTVNRAFTLDAGRFYTPFGIERFVWYSPTNALVSRPLAAREIVPGNFYANGLRASGVLKTRGSDTFIYEVALSDGLGDDALDNRRGSRQTRDNNSSRAISTRLAYAFWPKLEIGTSYHRQRYASDQDLDLTFFGLDFAGRFKGFELRAEYVDADVERGLVSPTGVLTRLQDLRQDGWYAQLAYAFHFDREFLPELELVGRLDQLDLDGDVTGNDDRDAFSLGINALLYDHFRLKAEYQFVDEDGPGLENDAFRLQFVIDY